MSVFVGSTVWPHLFVFVPRPRFAAGFLAAVLGLGFGFGLAAVKRLRNPWRAAALVPAQLCASGYRWLHKVTPHTPNGVRAAYSDTRNAHPRT